MKKFKWFKQGQVLATPQDLVPASRVYHHTFIVNGAGTFTSVSPITTDKVAGAPDGN